MKISFYLKYPKKTDSEVKLNSLPELPIYARICYEGNKMKFYPGEAIKPEFWNADDQRAKQTKKFPQYPEFNARLDNIESAIKKLALKYANENENKYPLPDILKSLLNDAFKNNKPKHGFTFMSFFDKFIEDCKNGVRKTKRGKPIKASTIKNYESTKVVLLDYQKHSKRKIEFATIDIPFYNDFNAYLITEKKHSTNYIAKHIKELKAVLSYATELKINTNLDFKMGGFSAITEETDSVYLTESELKEMADLDLSDNLPLDRARDLFLVGCKTGLRYSDWATITPDQINGDFINITQTKTGKPVVIPVHDTVKVILSKYGGRLPRSITNQKMNVFIKDVAKQCKLLKKKVGITKTKGGKLVTDVVPKWSRIATHTARRSFCTNLSLSGVPSHIIMGISGHDTETSFKKYIKVTNDEKAIILKAHWEQQKTQAVKTIAI